MTSQPASVCRSGIKKDKTTTMVFSRKQVDCSVEVDGRKLENVGEQTYLGMILSEDGRMECELEKRIGAALSAAGAVRSQVFESRELSRSAKMLVYKAIIEPTLTYGAESRVLKEREKQRVQAAEMRVLRKIAGVSCGAGTQNERSLEEADRRTSWIYNRDSNEWSCTREKTKREAKKAMERCLQMNARMHVDISVLVIFRILNSI